MHIELTKMSCQKKVLLMISLFAVIRIIAASFIGLGNDESYYWVYSKQLQWNYFDHPPGVAIMARLFSANGALQDHVLFLRIGSIICCAFSGWFMYKCVAEIKDEKAGWYAACLYTASFYAGITAGLLLMPDSPQMFFWTLCLWMIAKIVHAKTDKLLYWILFGIAASCCIMSKVHGMFIWIGLGGYVLFQKRSWLSYRGFWLALFITAVIVSPILFWNIQHDFITWRFHSERVIPNGHSTYIGLIRELCGELVVNNPVNVILIVVALLTGKMYTRSAALRIYLFAALPFIACLLLMAFFRKTLPHWSGPAYIALVPCAAVYLSERKAERISSLMPKISLLVFSFFLAGCTLFILFYPGTTGNKDEGNLGKGDISLDAYGWDTAGKEFLKVRDEDVASGKMKVNSPLVCDSWWGAHEEYYFCRPAGIQMLALGELHEIHQYYWLNKERFPQADSLSAYCVVHSDEHFDAMKAFGKYYRSSDTAAVIPVYRGGKKAHIFYVLRLRKSQ